MSRQPHTIPASPPPGFGRQFGEMLAQHGANHSNSTSALLSARSDALGHILSNIERIANVGGGAQSPDRLLQGFAGAQGTMIGGPYAEAMDRLRLAQAAANVSATNRSGSGGGGGGGGSGGPEPFGDPRTWIVRDANGVVTEMDPSDYDTSVLSSILDGSAGVTVLQRGQQVPQEIAQQFQPPTRNTDNVAGPGASGPARRTFEDGSYIEDGKAYNADGTPLG